MLKFIVPLILGSFTVGFTLPLSTAAPPEPLRSTVPCGCFADAYFTNTTGGYLVLESEDFTLLDAICSPLDLVTRVGCEPDGDKCNFLAGSVVAKDTLDDKDYFVVITDFDPEPECGECLVAPAYWKEWHILDLNFSCDICVSSQ